MDTTAKEPSWDSMAASLGISQRTMQNWRKRPDAPRNKDLLAWQTYKQVHGLGQIGAKQILPEWREQEARSKNRLLELKIQREEGKVVSRVEVNRLLHHIATQQKIIMTQLLETELPAKCEGMTATQIRGQMRKAADQVCDQMAGIVDQWQGKQ